MVVSHPRRLALRSAVPAALVAVLAALLMLGTPAGAADTVEVHLQGLDNEVVAGGSGADFQVSFNNTGPGGSFSAALQVHLDGAPAGSIHLRRRNGGSLSGQPGDNGTVTFTDDPFDLSQGQSVNRRYVLSFDAGVPVGQASLTIAALSSGGQSLGSAGGTIAVVSESGHGGPDASPTPPNTDPGFVPTYEAGTNYSIAPPPQAQEPTQLTASVPKALYWLGAGLVVLGLATLFLIFRPPGRIPARAAIGADRINPVPARLRRQEPPAGGGPQAWPVVSRPTTPPGRRPARGDSAPHTATGRPIRDPGPGEGIPPWLRP